MEFEFHAGKSDANKAKHGIDLVSAQAVWLDENRVEIPARTEDEPRWLVIGKIADRHWSVVFTVREGRARLISARRARPEEEAIYEGEGL